jgi:hypothetical protein
MEKNKLDGFINRYTLGGNIESVMIKSTDTDISVRMISDDKTLLGEVKVNDSGFPEGEFGIYTTSQLKSLLGVLDNTITVDEGKGSITFSDKDTEVNYMLAAPSVIPPVPDLKQLPEFNIEIPLNDEFVSKFVKSKGALSDTDTFTFMSKGGKSKVVLNYSTINTNRISLTVDAKCDVDVEGISFSSEYLKSILLANKGSSASSLQISTDGLAKLNFTDGDYETEYFLVEMK